MIDAADLILMLDPENAYALSVKPIAEKQVKARGGNASSGNTQSPAKNPGSKPGTRP